MSTVTVKQLFTHPVKGLTPQVCMSVALKAGHGIPGDRAFAVMYDPDVIIVLEGVSAWAEFDWVGQEFELGTARLEITAPINRCLNIDVNPDTGERDIPLFSLLQK